MEELFEKVYIRSEADLPKEEGWYICSGKGQLRKYYWRNGESDIWIISNRIDWYLRPLEAEQPSNNRQQSKDSANNLKTAEEILKGEMSENLWTFICSYPVSYKSEEKLVEWIIDAMQEYAAQFKAEQEKVTDELVFKWLKDRKYQTSYGEQEYKMYFDVDMPKIIREAINHFTIEKVTDEDIDYFMCEVIFSQFDSYWDAMKYGAKAMRDGLITHTK